MSSDTYGQSKAYLIVQRGGEIGSVFPLEKRQTTIGRNADNTIVLNDVMVSRYHAVIRYDQASGTVTVVDLGSTNGVIVNDMAVDPGQPHPLQQRDAIFIGHSVFNLQIRPNNYQPSSPPSREEDKDITQHLDMRQLFS